MALAGFITELRRRRVFRATGLYIVAAWVAVQVASLVFPAISVPASALLYVWLVALFLLPMVIVFAWFYDVTASGISRTRPASIGEDFDPSLRRADHIILAALGVVAIAVMFEFTSRIEGTVDTIRDAVDPFSIAVLPLDNMIGDLEQQYFVSGMQAGLISGLSRIRALRVTSKISTLQYRDAQTPLAEIGKQLGVARVVEGSVLRSGSLVSIAVQLLDARRDEQIWSATFEDEIENVMLLQSRVAQEIAGQIRVTLTPEERAGFMGAKPVNAPAYEAFLKGVFYVERFTPDDVQRAAGYFEQAVELQPDSALGHWGLAKLCLFQAQMKMLSPSQARAQCRPPLERALELDPLLADAYSGLAGTLTWQHFDWDAARPNFERAIQLNPSFAEAHMFYSHYLGIVGELGKSSEHMQFALELDPMNPFVHALSAAQLVMLGEFERAAEVAQRILDENPGFGFGYGTLSLAHHYLGNEEQSFAAFADFLEQVVGEPEIAAIARGLHVELGYRQASLELAEFMLEQTPYGQISPSTIATLYENGGDVEKAIDWYEIAFRNGDPDAPYIGVLSKTPEINAHPRFQQLLRDMKLYYWADKYADQSAAGG